MADEAPPSEPFLPVEVGPVVAPPASGTAVTA